MGFRKRASGAVGVWLAITVCGVHQAVAAGDPPSPAATVQPVKAETAVAAPAATPASTTTVTEGATPVATPTSATIGTDGAARVPAVSTKATPNKNSYEDPVLTSAEVKRLLSQGYRQEKLSNGNIQYCRKDNHTGSMIPKWQCTTSEQLRAMDEDKREFSDMVQEKGGVNPRPAPAPQL